MPGMVEEQFAALIACRFEKSLNVGQAQGEEVLYLLLLTISSDVGKLEVDKLPMITF